MNGKILKGSVLIVFVSVLVLIALTGQNYAADPYKPEMVLIKGGTFLISISKTQNTTVNLSPFWIGKYEVTNAEYKLFCDETKKKYPEVPEMKNYFLKYPDHPVIYVSWYDAVEYCNWLSRKNKAPVVYSGTGARISMDIDKKGFRLPSEAEWAVAARGGLTQKNYPWGNEAPSSRANFKDYRGSIRRVSLTWGIGPWKVGSCEEGKNGYGLYDMAGNVWEWVYDYAESPPPRGRNPIGKPTGTQRRIMGGGWWEHGGEYIRLDNRGLPLGPTNAGLHLGFRVAQTR